MSFLRQEGPPGRRLLSFLRRREKQERRRHAAMDEALEKTLLRPLGIVFTDTADFTLRTARDGLLHFLMVFQRILDSVPAALRPHRGRIVKVEADSLLLAFPDAVTACLGAASLERLLRRMNAGRPANERLRFSYGIGYGDVLELPHDLFGLEVNLASKLGEDLARPGEALLTPAAREALGGSIVRRRLVPYRSVRYGRSTYTIERFVLGR